MIATVGSVQIQTFATLGDDTNSWIVEHGLPDTIGAILAMGTVVLALVVSFIVLSILLRK